MDVVELIRRDHDEIAEQFERLAVLARSGRTGETERVAARLVVAVRLHAYAEEHTVYEVLRSRSGPLKAFALAGPHEHETLDITVDKLLGQPPGEELAVLVRVAHDLFEMHARDEEEADVLPVIRAVLGAEELAALARDLADEKARLRPRVERMAGLLARAA